MSDDARFDAALDELDRAIDAKSGAQTLDAFLAAWRVKKAPELADAIEALSQRYAEVVPRIAGKTERAGYEQFLDLVTKRRSTDVGRLVAELPTATVSRGRASSSWPTARRSRRSSGST